MIFPNFMSAGTGTITETDLINYRISRLANTGKPQEEFLYANMQEWMSSDKRKLMLAAQKYYENDNDITKRVRYYIDRNGVQKEATNLSNAKLPHPYFKKLVNQKVNYLLTQEFSVSCDDDNFMAALNKYLNKAFKRMLKNVGKDAIVNSIAWVQPYYDFKGVLQFKRIPSEEVKPFWADADHTILEGVLRSYVIQVYSEGGTVTSVTKVEYHTAQGVWYYTQGPKGLISDTDKGDGPQGHFILTEPVLDDNGVQKLDEQGNAINAQVQAVWDRVPFIAFKYNADEISLLKWTKPLIDDYDLTTSDHSNNLQDVPNAIKVVKNYDGSDKGEFVQNLATFRTVFVGEDGDVTTVKTELDTAAVDSHLNRLRKDIYEAGSGVDTQEADLGNASGVALKFRYTDLDMDSSDMAAEFSASLEQLIWFIKVDILNRGEGDFMDVDFDIVFNTDMIANETETITQAKESVGIVSDETILANHPWVTDVQEEQKRLKKQKAEALKDMEKTLTVESGFGNDDTADEEDTPPAE